MNQQKKIDELKDTMSRIINDDMYWILDEDDSRYLAENLIEAGYRKASDVAREIFEEVEDVINNIGYFDEIDFRSLKKKYLGEDINAPTKESEGEG